MLVPFIVYADFESINMPTKLWEELHQAVSETFPGGFCYHKKCFDDILYSPVTFVKEFNDDDVAQIFIVTLEKNIKDIYKKFKFPKSMIMTKHDKLIYDNSTLCHICNEELGKDRVRDNCHLSGKFRDAAHEVCNLKYKVPKYFCCISKFVSLW